MTPVPSRRSWAAVACAALVLSACGHYARPIRSRPAAEPAAQAAPDVPAERADTPATGDQETHSDAP